MNTKERTFGERNPDWERIANGECPLKVATSSSLSQRVYHYPKLHSFKSDFTFSRPITYTESLDGLLSGTDLDSDRKIRDLVPILRDKHSREGLLEDISQDHFLQLSPQNYVLVHKKGSNLNIQGNGGIVLFYDQREKDFSLGGEHDQSLDEMKSFDLNACPEYSQVLVLSHKTMWRYSLGKIRDFVLENGINDLVSHIANFDEHYVRNQQHAAGIIVRNLKRI